MPAVIVTENWSDRQFAPGESAQRGWVVTGVDNERDAILAIGAEARENAQFILDGSLLADPPDCRREKGPLAFHVVTRYRKDDASGGGGGLTNIIDWDWEEGQSSGPTDVDADGVPILNAAGFPFANKAQDDNPLSFIVAERNERSYDIQLSINYRGAVNSDRVKFLGYWIEPGQARLLSYRPTHSWNELTTQFRNAYRIELLKGGRKIVGTQTWDGFYHRILNAGFMGWYDDGGLKPGPFVNANGVRLTEPVPLDASGKPLDGSIQVESSDGTAETAVAYQSLVPAFIEDAGDATFMKYPKAKRLPFRALGIFRS